jgi:hypothetical protein
VVQAFIAFPCLTPISRLNQDQAWNATCLGVRFHDAATSDAIIASFFGVGIMATSECGDAVLGRPAADQPV